MTRKLLAILNTMMVFISVLWISSAANIRSTISNANPRLTSSGDVVDAHSGNIVGPINGTYYLYGEWYGKGNFAVVGATDLPKLAVYSSPNLTSGSWTFHGLLHNNTNPGWSGSPAWPWHPHGAWYSPWAVYVEARKKIVLWFSAFQSECCVAQWGVAESDDGIHFTLISMTRTPSLNASVDGSALFVDDDGTGYVAYTAVDAKGMHDHIVAIDRLAPDMLTSTGERVALFPDYFVEGVMLFKRKGVYYVLYGSCCCACRQGSGVVVYMAPAITGPWVQQSRDVNCKADVPICAGMPSELGEKVRPTGQLTINAQGLALSILPTGVPGESTVLWHGQRWLSGPNNPPKCSTLCAKATGDCAQPPNYDKGADFDYCTSPDSLSHGWMLSVYP